MGMWLDEQLTIFKDGHEQWKKHFKSCKKSYNKYIEKDAECDCAQAECEARNCEYDKCHWGNCDGIYNTCWGKCLIEKKRIEEDKECLEKDRKIDWSATEKIECYVNVLLEQPTKEDLLANCGTEDCYSKYREMMYLKCNDICVAIDFDAGGFEEHSYRTEIDADFRKGIAHEGKIRDQRTHLRADIRVAKSEFCRTKHRAGDAPEMLAPETGPVTFEDGRCTSHLDLCYPADPCCRPCAQCESSPCEGKGVSAHGDEWPKEHDGRKTYMFLHYGQHNFLSPKTVAGMESDTVCHEQLEHTLIYAYNLCECIECGEKEPVDPPTCTNDNACPYDGADYNYRQHDIIEECSAAPDVNPYADAAKAAR
jgi:hypothetical protein